MSYNKYNYIQDINELVDTIKDEVLCSVIPVLYSKPKYSNNTVHRFVLPTDSTTPYGKQIKYVLFMGRGGREGCLTLTCFTVIETP